MPLTPKTTKTTTKTQKKTTGKKENVNKKSSPFARKHHQNSSISAKNLWKTWFFGREQKKGAKQGEKCLQLRVCVFLCVYVCECVCVCKKEVHSDLKEEAHKDEDEDEDEDDGRRTTTAIGEHFGILSATTRAARRTTKIVTTTTTREPDSLMSLAKMPPTSLGISKTPTTIRTATTITTTTTTTMTTRRKNKKNLVLFAYYFANAIVVLVITSIFGTLANNIATSPPLHTLPLLAPWSCTGFMPASCNFLYFLIRSGKGYYYFFTYFSLYVRWLQLVRSYFYFNVYFIYRSYLLVVLFFILEHIKLNIWEAHFL